MLDVLGNACRDITFRVEILPRPGETLNARITHGGLGGKGLNQAIAAARAEMDVPHCCCRKRLCREPHPHTLRAATDTLIDFPGETGRWLHAIPSQPELADEKISLHVPPRAGRR